jgi:hypothetical protein
MSFLATIEGIFGRHARVHTHRPRRRHIRVYLHVDNFAVELHANRKEFVMVAVTQGHTVNMTLQFVDTSGNPMLTQPTPDAAPTWTDTPVPAGIDTLTVAPGGLTATLVTTAVGADTVTLVAIVGGVSYTGTLGVTIAALPQVLGGVQILATVT